MLVRSNKYSIDFDYSMAWVFGNAEIAGMNWAYKIILVAMCLLKIYILFLTLQIISLYAFFFLFSSFVFVMDLEKKL